MKKRILAWIISLIIAVSYIAISEYIKNLPEKEVPKIMKDTVSEYNDIGNGDIIEKVFKNSNLNKTKKLNHVTSQSSANIIISEDLEQVSTENGNTILTSYTPLIIGMKKSDKLLTYQEKGLLNSSEEIDFKKIIDAVLEGKTWS